MSKWAFRAVLRCRCGGELATIANTRGREREDVIYRQRKCNGCGELTSTREVPADDGVALAQAERLEAALQNVSKLLAEMGLKVVPA